MPALFTLPQTVGLSATNQLLPGAKLYFRISGTSTPQPTYQDIALTVPHANPVVADGAGVFDPIYLDPGLPSYRVILTDSADVTQPGYPIDNYPSNQNAGQTYRLAATAPELVFEQTNATANNKKWRVRVTAEQMRISLLDDAESSAVDVVTIDRTLNVCDLINVASTSLKHNSVDLATLTTGSFSGTVTGMTTAVPVTVRYKIVGNIVFINVQSALGTSNATTMTITGAPEAIWPARFQRVPSNNAVDNGAVIYTGVLISIGTDGVLTYWKDGSETGWTNSGGKNPASVYDSSFFYFLD